MKTILSFVVLIAMAGCGTQGDGQRCNPLRATSDCDDGYSCVYPTAPSCGVSYCCAVDDKGNITDSHPNCQPDPSLDSVCGLEEPDLGGSTD